MKIAECIEAEILIKRAVKEYSKSAGINDEKEAFLNQLENRLNIIAAKIKQNATDLKIKTCGDPYEELLTSLKMLYFNLDRVPKYVIRGLSL